MKTTHTLGPWITDDIDGLMVVGAQNNGAVIVELESTAQNTANAALIAAAPDMLSVLEAIKTYFNNGDDSEMLGLINDVVPLLIAKARGES